MAKLSIFITFFAIFITGSSLALEMTAISQYEGAQEILQNDLDSLKTLIETTGTNFAEQISQTNHDITETKEEIAAIRYCNEHDMIFAPENSTADANGCTSINKLPNVSLYSSVQLHTPGIGNKTLALGVHDFCALNYIGGPGGYDTVCSVTAESYGIGKRNWTLKSIDQSNGGESQGCLAICFDINN